MIFWYNMAEFVNKKPKCKYCKDTGMVELATSSKPCIDCDINNKNYTKETFSDNEIIILESGDINGECI